MTAMEEPFGPGFGDEYASHEPVPWGQARHSRSAEEAEWRRELKSLQGKAFPPRPDGDVPARVIDLPGRRSAVGEGLHGEAIEGLARAQEAVAGVHALAQETCGLPVRPQMYADSMNAAARLANSAHAAMVLHATRLAAHPGFRFEDEYGHVNSAPEEIGMALSVPAPTAGRWIAAGRDLFGRLSGIGELFARGDLNLGKALAIAESLRRASDALAWEVEDRILPHVAEWTITETERKIAELLIEIDPELAEQRHQEARKSRFVTRLSILADGMASLKVKLPADSAVTLDTALSQAAATGKVHGDTRTTQQLRADTLTSWALNALVNGAEHVLAGEDGVPSGEVVCVPPARVNLTMPLEVAARTIPDWNGTPSSLERIYHELNGEDWEWLEGSNREGLPAGSNREGLRGDSSAAAQTDCYPDGRTEAAWLEGYGPITPSTAILMSAGGSWRRIITDTATGLPLDVGRASYSPPVGIQIAVRLRDRVCTRPGCGAPAYTADHDHVKEWGEGGVTSMEGIALLCRRCHRIKSLGGGHLTRCKDTGEWVWVSTLGSRRRRTVEREPRKVIHALPRALSEEEAAAAERAARDCGLTLVPNSLAPLRGGEADPRTRRPTPWKPTPDRPRKPAYRRREKRNGREGPTGRMVQTARVISTARAVSAGRAIPTARITIPERGAPTARPRASTPRGGGPRRRSSSPLARSRSRTLHQTLRRRQ
ncbi:MAG TPA: DUF222 domain-containing protein [Actinomycetales bacterium]|nr:DUF222 domain-containing protein [Actinomycetales bacterium]